MPLKEPPARVVLFVWREPWFVIFVGCGCQWPGCETGYSSLWTRWNIHRSSAESRPSLTHTHTHIRATARPFWWNSTQTSTWNLLSNPPIHLPHRKRKLTSWCCAHNRNTGARSVGVKPCCSAPVLPAEGWLIAVVNKGLMPCNYSSEARLSALESRGKCGHSCNRRCRAGKEIVLFKRSGKKCFIGQGGGGRVFNAHRWRHCVKNALCLVYCVHEREKENYRIWFKTDNRCESQKNANRNTMHERACDLRKHLNTD